MKLIMISFNTCLLAVCLITLSFCHKTASDTAPDPTQIQPTLSYTNGSRIAWDYSTLKKVSSAAGYNGYARLIQLKDRSLICTYESAGSIVVVKSTDLGVSWSNPVTVEQKGDGINMAVPDILQLNDGSILVCFNPRPFNISPERKFGIRIKKSYDGGSTWVDGRLLYEADYLFENGCWEPSAIQLPSGEIQLYFANEGIYKQSNEQNISLLRSSDNGLSWSKTPQIVSFRNGSRDGMPVPVLLNNGKEIAFAIEDNGFTNFKPYIIKNTVSQNWNTIVDGASTARTYALENKIADDVYAGAPYLRQLPSGETILSYQGAEGRTNSIDFSEMKVVIGNNEANSFNRKSVPFALPGSKSGLWNSLNVIEGNTVVALTSTNGLSSSGATEVWMIKGHVIAPLSASKDKITIDGGFTENAWKSDFPVFVGHKGLTRARAQVTFDDNNLYVLTDVRDDNISISTANSEESDGTIIYVHAKSKTFSNPDNGVFSITVSADNKVTVKEGENGSWVKRDVGSIKSSSVKAANSYRQEIAIPWTLLKATPSPNAMIGFNFGITENTGRAQADYKETITTCEDTKPNTWMTLTLN